MRFGIIGILACFPANGLKFEMSKLWVLVNIGKRTLGLSAIARGADTDPKGGRSPQITPSKPTIESTALPRSSRVGQFKAPTALDRYFLVWSGQFKNRSEIPPQIEIITLHKARDWGRIRVNIFILFFAAGCSVIAIYVGRRARESGETVESQNLAWHKQIKDDYEREKKQK